MEDVAISRTTTKRLPPDANDLRALHEQLAAVRARAAFACYLAAFAVALALLALVTKGP